jgi:hypothetical protein
MSSLSTSKLPNALENLVDSYVDETKHNLSITSNKLLYEEVKDIDKDYLLKCKYAHQCAEKYKTKYADKVSVSCLAGIFISLLDIFSYEEILNADVTKCNDGLIDDYTSGEELKDYIDQLIYTIIKSNSPSVFNNGELIDRKIDEKISDINLEILKTYKTDNKSYHYSIIIEICFHKLCADSNISLSDGWHKYNNQLTPYIKKLLVNLKNNNKPLYVGYNYKWD